MPPKPETSARVRSDAKGTLTARERSTTRLYQYPWILGRGEVIGPAFQPVTMDRPSLLVFADEEPDAGFGHPCSYLLYDANSGAPIHQIIAEFPPYPLEGLGDFEPIWTPERTKFPRANGAAPTGAPEALADQMRAAGEAFTTAAGGKRYAILFAGAADQAHLNDLEASYRMLIRDFKFDSNNIRVLFHDGTKASYLFQDVNGNTRPWPGSILDPSFYLDVKGAGTRSNFRQALIDFNIGANDSLFIHAEGHGGHFVGGGNVQCFLAEFSASQATSRYTASEMKEDLGGLNNYRALLVLMNQCYGGGFALPIVDGTKAGKTYVAYAAAANKRAFMQSDDWYDFSFDWIQAQMGARVGDDHLPLPGTPPETNPDGSVKASGAFRYAKAHVDNRASPNALLKPDPGAEVLSLRE